MHSRCGSSAAFVRCLLALRSQNREQEGTLGPSHQRPSHFGNNCRSSLPAFVEIQYQGWDTLHPTDYMQDCLAEMDKITLWSSQYPDASKTIHHFQTACTTHSSVTSASNDHLMTHRSRCSSICLIKRSMWLPTFEKSPRMGYHRHSQPA